MAKCMMSVLTPEQVAKCVRFEATPPYQSPERYPRRFGGAIELSRRKGRLRVERHVMAH
jgi:hypothetical protein